MAYELGRMSLTLKSCDGIEPLGVTAKNGSLAALFVWVIQWAGKGEERATTGLQRPPAGCSGALMV